MSDGPEPAMRARMPTLALHVMRPASACRRVPEQRHAIGANRPLSAGCRRRLKTDPVSSPRGQDSTVVDTGILAQPIDGLRPIGSLIACPTQAFGLWRGPRHRSVLKVARTGQV